MRPVGGRKGIPACVRGVSPLTLEGISTRQSTPAAAGWFAAAGLLLFAVLPPRAALAALAVPDYPVGATAVVDVVTPVPLIVVDPERTAKLREQEAQRVAAIFRYLPETADDAENAVRATFLTTREKFLDVVQGTFRRRTLTPDLVEQARFQKLAANFQKQIRPFPFTTNLAAVWALGESDEPLLAPLLSQLRTHAQRHIRADVLPPAGRTGPQQARLITVADAQVPLELEAVEKQSIGFYRSNMVALGRVRKELQAAFPPEQQGWAKFLAGFVKENCLFDEALTRTARAKRTDPLWTADRYESGQAIVKAGDTVNARTKAALDQLRAETAVDRVKAEAAREQADAQAALDRLQEQARQAELAAQANTRLLRWVLAGLGLALVFSLGIVFGFRRRVGARAWLPAPLADPKVPALSAPPLSSDAAAAIASPGAALTSGSQMPAADPVFDAWKERALAAEQRLERTQAAAHAALRPHLLRWLKDWLTRRLLADRGQLLSVQQQAALEMARLEQRLAELHAPLAERVKVYEQRIAELERALAAKGAENRELLKAMIDLARRKLEAERAPNSEVTWN